MSNLVELIQHSDAHSFNQCVKDFLLRNEALHHAMLSHCYALTHTPELYYFSYADSKNTFSNRMYEAMGYELMGETQNYRFATAK